MKTTRLRQNTHLIRILAVWLALLTSGAVSADSALNTLAFTKSFIDRIEGLAENILPYQHDAFSTCENRGPNQTFALLVGPSRPIPAMRPIAGSANDVAILGAALRSRGVASDNIFALSGPTAVYSAVVSGATDIYDRATCGDTVVFHFSGLSLKAQDVFLTRDALSGAGGAFTAGQPVLTLSDLATGGALGTFRKGEGDYYINKAPFLILNHTGAAREGVISAHALSDMVTVFRNKGVDVAVSLDVSNAPGFDIDFRQIKADTSLYSEWILTANPCVAETGPDRDRFCGTPAFPLSPRRGELAVFYSTGTEEQAFDAQFDSPTGRNIYGAFTYHLARAILESGTITPGAIGRHIEAQDLSDALSPNLRIVATDPDLNLLAKDRPHRGQTRGEIQITSPRIDTGPVTAQSKVATVVGKIDAITGTANNVLVNGDLAQVDPDGGFSAQVPLDIGLNTVSVFASTDQNELFYREFEIYYEGDFRNTIEKGTNYLIVIANEDYQAESGFLDLKTPVGDGRRVADIMVKRFGFKTTARRDDGSTLDLHLENATYRDVQLLMGEFSNIAGPDDAVIVFFAGHGEYSATTNTGYWLPVDAKAGLLATYLDSKVITDTLLISKAKNAIVISDSCYSGMLARGSFTFEEPEGDDRQRALQRLSDQRTRVVISSGGNEPVLDGGGDGHSVFARSLITALTDQSFNAFTARELHGRIFQQVSAKASQKPDIRPIHGAGHEGGDLVFVAR